MGTMERGKGMKGWTACEAERGREDVPKREQRDIIERKNKEKERTKMAKEKETPLLYLLARAPTCCVNLVA